jgi:sulfur carrier protein ThiS
MAVVWVRTHGSLSSHSVEDGLGKGDGAPVTFRGKKLKVREVFSRLHINEEAVSFVAINGVKSAKDAWVTDGDRVTIFALVAGG